MVKNLQPREPHAPYILTRADVTFLRSLRIHPETPCPICRGTGCTWCSGTGLADPMPRLGMKDDP